MPDQIAQALSRRRALRAGAALALAAGSKGLRAGSDPFTIRFSHVVAEDTPMTEALLEISQKGYGVTGVTGQAGELVGIITDGDLRRHMQGLLDHSAADVMTAHPRTIRPDQLAEAALAEMQSRKITSLFAVDDGMPQGILNIHDCLRAGMV